MMVRVAGTVTICRVYPVRHLVCASRTYPKVSVMVRVDLSRNSVITYDIQI